MRMMLSAAQMSVQCCTKYWHITGHQGSIRQHFSQSLWNVEGRLWMEYWLRQMQPWWKQTCRQQKHRYFKREEQRQAGSGWNSNWEKLQTMCTTLSSLSLSLSLWTWLNHQASGHGMIEQATKHGIKPRHQKLRGKHRGASAGPGAQDCTVSIWLGKRHKLLQWDNTNLDGQILGEEPPSHPSLQEGCALTEELSAVALPWEEQQLELEMTDRKDYGLYRVAVSRINKVDCRLWWIDHHDTYGTVRNQICVTLIYNTDRWLTLCDVDSKRALGDLLACEEHMNLVRALQNRTIGATENTVPFVFQDELHRVLFALRIDDDHTDIAITSTYVCQKTNDYWRTVVFYTISVSSGWFFFSCLPAV